MHDTWVNSVVRALEEFVCSSLTTIRTMTYPVVTWVVVVVVVVFVLRSSNHTLWFLV